MWGTCHGSQDKQAHLPSLSPTPGSSTHPTCHLGPTPGLQSSPSVPYSSLHEVTTSGPFAPLTISRTHSLSSWTVSDPGPGVLPTTPRPSHPTPCPPHGGMLLEPTFESLSRLNRPRARLWSQVSPDVLMAREPPAPGPAPRPARPRPPACLATPPGPAFRSQAHAVPAGAFAPPRPGQQPAVSQVRPHTSQPVGGRPAAQPVRAPATAPHRCNDPPSPPEGPRPLSPGVSRPGPPITSAQGTRWRDFQI